jgi:hypothetical protein
MARFGWRRFAGMFSSDPAVHRNSFVCLRSLALLSPVSTRRSPPVNGPSAWVADRWGCA